MSFLTPIISPEDTSSSKLTLHDLLEELKHVASFFLLATEFKEPYKMPSRHPSEKRIIGGIEIQPWLSKEDYLCVHTHTTYGRAFVQRLLIE